jgi:hypothetical protein
VVLKHFRRSAPNQERLLSAFEAAGWPREIDDPLPRVDGVVPGERLHDTIKWLNHCLEPQLILFCGTRTRASWRVNRDAQG